MTSMFSYYLSVLSESQKKKKNSYKNGLMSMSAFGTLFRGEKWLSQNKINVINKFKFTINNLICSMTLDLLYYKRRINY